MSLNKAMDLKYEMFLGMALRRGTDLRFRDAQILSTTFKRSNTKPR